MNIQDVKKIEDFAYIKVPGHVFRTAALPKNFNHTANYYRNLTRASVDKLLFWAQRSKNKKKSENLIKDARMIWRRGVWITNQLNERKPIKLCRT
jgi:hypothetical protein